MTKLSIGVPKYLEGEESFVNGRIVSVDKPMAENIRVPVGHGRYLAVDVDSGNYLVQVDLPSGLSLSRSITVGESEPQLILFRPPSSEHEWLSWSNFSTGIGELGTVPRGLNFAPPGVMQTLERLEVECWVGASRLSVTASFTEILVDGIQFQLQFESDWPYAVLNIRAEHHPAGIGLPFPRVFIVANTSSGRTFTTVPLPWINDEVVGQPNRSVDLLLSDPAFASGASLPSQAHLTATIRDPVFAAVFGYLASGNPSAALRVGSDLHETAIRMLSGTIANPYAAAGAAYLLLRAGSSPRDESWGNWLLNLANSFPRLPDGMVLAGWHLLNHSPETLEARGYFLEAVTRGIPVYTEGIRMLIEGLSVLNQDTDDMEIVQALKTARLYGARVDASQPFTVGAAGLLNSEGTITATPQIRENSGTNEMSISRFAGERSLDSLGAG